MQDDHFSWHDAKAASNPVRHDGVTFNQARSVFYDPDAEELLDDREAYLNQFGDPEERINITGLDQGGNVLVVTYTLRNSRYHIISARKANRNESRDYFTNRQP